MEYLIGVLISAIPYFGFGVILGLVVGYFHSKAKGFLVATLVILSSLVFGATAPSNTYKVKAERTPMGFVHREAHEIRRDKSLEERSEARKQVWEEKMNSPGPYSR